METLQYYLDNVIDFFSFSRPHSVKTWIPFSAILVFALMFLLIGFGSYTVGTIGLIFLVWFIRYDDFSMVERIIAIVLTIAVFSVSVYFLYEGEMSTREIGETYVAIDHLPQPVTVNDAEVVTYVRAMYDSLDDGQKQRFDSTYYDSLVAREKELEEAQHQAELKKQRDALWEEYDAAIEVAKQKKLLEHRTESQRSADEDTDKKSEKEKQAEQEVALYSQVELLNTWWKDTYMKETLFPNTLSCVEEFQVKNGNLIVFVDENKQSEAKVNKNDVAKCVGLSLYLYPERITAKNWNSDTDLTFSSTDVIGL